jgi:hypothetical protein
MLRKDKLYGWLFHYNPFRNRWEAVHKDNYSDLFSGGNHVLRHTSRAILEKIIVENDGKISKPMNLVG